MIPIIAIFFIALSQKKSCYFLTNVLKLSYKWRKVEESGLKW